MRAFVRILGLLVLIVVAGISFPVRQADADPSWSLAPGNPSLLPGGGVLEPASGGPVFGPQGAPAVVLTAAGLGLPAASNIDGLSYGDDMPFWGPPITYEFSVGPGAVGAPWLPLAPPPDNVGTQAAEGANQGDIFAQFPPLAPGGPACAPGAFANAELYDADGISVVLGPVMSIGGMFDPPPAFTPPYDDVDAYERLDSTAVDYATFLMFGIGLPDGRPEAPVFFSVDPATAAGLPLDPGGTGPISAADILVTDQTSATGWRVYANDVAIGLTPFDNIDGLLVADSLSTGPGLGGAAAGLGGRRTFSPATATDFVAYSLGPGSFSLGVLPLMCGGPNTAADMWAISPFFTGGLPIPWLAGEDLGLCTVRVGCFVTDNLDGIDIGWGPGGDADIDGLPDIVEGFGCAPAIPGANDSDADGLPDGIEAVMGGSPFGACVPGSIPDVGLMDSDFDLMPDGWEVTYWGICPGANVSVPDPGSDVDLEGAVNIVEYFQSTNPCIVDTDVDGFADLAPTAHQGPANTSALVDNCPNVVNPAQTNSDGNFVDLSPPKLYDDMTWANSDAMGDACDTDDDNDALLDTTESPGPPCGSTIGATMTTVRDSDGDRVLDGAECANLTNANSALSFPPIATCQVAGDLDADGVFDSRETCYYNTSTGSGNTDFDALTDECEIASINADGVVNVIDVQQVAQHTPAGGGGYLVNMDLNKDGVINVLDVQYAAFRAGVGPLPCP